MAMLFAPIPLVHMFVLVALASPEMAQHVKVRYFEPGCFFILFFVCGDGRDGGGRASYGHEGH